MSYVGMNHATHGIESFHTGKLPGKWGGNRILLRMACAAAKGLLRHRTGVLARVYVHVCCERGVY